MKKNIAAISSLEFKRSKILISFVFYSVSFAVFSQSDNKNLYSGGMLFFQPGYTFSENNHQRIEEISLGIGGILRFYFYENFTAGIYGGTQRTKYSSAGSDNSTMSLGYGGPFIGYSRQAGKFRYTLSAFAGKGTVKNLHIESQNGNNLTEAYLYKNPVLVFSPIFSVDYAITQRLVLSLQAVCLTASLHPDNTLYNPTLQLGILFNR